MVFGVHLFQLILYSTEGCHLCELAEQVIVDAMGQQPYHLDHVDIALSDALMKEYGWTIPVVKIANTNHELGWPFDKSHFSQWLKDSTSC
jgi:hypothetical protein